LKRKGSSKRQELQVTAFLSWFSSPSWFRKGLSLVQTPGKADISGVPEGINERKHEHLE